MGLGYSRLVNWVCQLSCGSVVMSWSMVNFHTVSCHVMVNGQFAYSQLSCHGQLLILLVCNSRRSPSQPQSVNVSSFVVDTLRNFLRATHAGAVPASCHSLGTFISENIVATRRIKQPRRSFRGRRGGRAAVFFEYRSSVSATAVKHGSNKPENIA